VCLVSHIKLNVDIPKHGWLPVRLELDDYAIECNASYILNDPVSELLDLLENVLASNFDGSRVCLWLEPPGYAIDVFATLDPDRCSLRILYGESVNPPMESGRMELCFECNCELTLLKRTLLEALTGLLQEANDNAMAEWIGNANAVCYRERLKSMCCL